MVKNKKIKVMALIDLDKFVASFITEMKECSQMRNFSIPRGIKKALDDQGLEYKNGEIVKSQRRVSAEAKGTGYGESEDERIRKNIMLCLEECVHSDIIRDYEKDECIAWLEKQCSNLVECEQDNIEDLTDFEKALQPKFKIGDWVVNNGHSYLITDIDFLDNRYLFEIGGYTHEQLNWEYVENVDKNYHLWSIEDAKPGDVLSSELCDTIMLYKGIEDNNIQFYCDYDFSDIDVPGARFAINNGQHYGSVDDCEDWHPATKEQRDMLFQKMHEAGYAFDFESKELKKIEQKPTWATNDDEEFYIAINALKDVGQYDSVAWLLTIKQRIGG